MKLGILIIVIVLVLGGLFYFFSPKPQVKQVENTPSVTPSPSKAVNSDKLTSLVIRENALVSGEEVIRLNEGDTVILTLEADTDDELHIHGYDKVVSLKKDTPVQISLRADISGRFPIELHNTETEIAVLEVQPK